ncbi:MAG: leucine-rich repeat domain-containing protein [Chloroflexota bacterium]
MGVALFIWFVLRLQPLFAAASQEGTICDTVSEIPQVECQSLVTLYERTDGANWLNQADWLSTTTPCTWHGVTCYVGRVTKLDLQSNQLSGTIPAEVGNLSVLEELLLFNNQLSGEIPVELGNLSALQQLWLAVNQLTGPIPTELGNLTNLVALRLEYNGLNETMPTSLTQLVNLHTAPYNGLNVGYNRLTASDSALVNFLREKDPDWDQTQTVPPTNVDVTIQSIGSIELTWTPIAYQDNGGAYEIGVATTAGGPYTLHGSTIDKTAMSYLASKLEPGTSYYFVVRSRTPAHGSQQNELESAFGLEVMAATPAVPANFCDSVTDILADECGGLQRLFADSAGTAWKESAGWMTTPTACSWHGITCDAGRIVELDLAANELSGAIPVELGSLARLERLYMERNELTGPIPGELGNLTSLTELYLAENGLSGTIPAALGQLASLQLLDLNGNQLDGNIPAELGNLTMLEGLWLDGNQLSGSIPAALGELANLQTLWLFNNQLSDPLPTALGDLTSLRDLRLHGNQLTGVIPLDFGKLTSLKRLYLHNNQLNGDIPTELSNLANLERLYLYDNHLSGAIPAELGDLTNLSWLQLHGNQLQEAIPSELGNLAVLEWLNLYENRLSGTIPSELGNLQGLIGLNLHGNQLSGSIPAALGNLANLTSLNLSRNALTGPVPVELANLTQLNGATPDATDLGYNGLTASTAALQTFLDGIDPDWAETQTAPPAYVQSTPTGATSVSLTWSPIPYTGDGGHYEISSAPSPDGPITYHGATPDKATSSYQVENLPPDTTHYFFVRSYTPAHDQQQNEVWSKYRLAVSAEHILYLPLVSR